MTDRHKSKVVSLSVSLRRIQVRHRDGGPERPRHRDSELIWTLGPTGRPPFISEVRRGCCSGRRARRSTSPRSLCLSAVPRRRSERSLQRSASCRSARSHSGLGARPPDPRSSRSPTHRELSTGARHKTSTTTKPHTHSTPHAVQSQYARSPHDTGARHKTTYGSTCVTAMPQRQQNHTNLDPHRRRRVNRACMRKRTSLRSTMAAGHCHCANTVCPRPLWGQRPRSPPTLGRAEWQQTVLTH